MVKAKLLSLSRDGQDGAEIRPNAIVADKGAGVQKEAELQGAGRPTSL